VFVSQDPVAIDSVCYDFLRTEWNDYPHYDGTDDYLHEAALANDPPSGTIYDPENDGVPLESLGVHEQWNNSTDKQYSRNLGTGEGIELIQASPENIIPGDFELDGDVDFDDLCVLSTYWLESNRRGCIGDLDGDNIVDLKDLAIFAQNWYKD